MAARVRASPNPKRKAEQRRSSKSEARDRRDRVQASPIPTKKSGAQPSGEVLSALGRPLYPHFILSTTARPIYFLRHTRHPAHLSFSFQLEDAHRTRFVVKCCERAIGNDETNSLVS